MTTATKTPTTDEMIASRRTDYHKRRAARKDELDLDRHLTQRQVNAYLAETAKIDTEIAAFEKDVATWAAVPPLDPLTRWQNFLTPARDTLNAELLAIKRPIRDREIQRRADNLEQSITLIGKGLRGNEVTLAPLRIGELMQAAGYAVEGPALRSERGWLGSLPETEQRINDLAKRRATAEARLADVLMTDEERAKQEATHAAYREALNRLRLRGNSTGDGFVVCNEYDEVIDPATLTEIERKAIAWFEAAHFGRPRETVPV